MGNYARRYTGRLKEWFIRQLAPAIVERFADVPLSTAVDKYDCRVNLQGMLMLPIQAFNLDEESEEEYGHTHLVPAYEVLFIKERFDYQAPEDVQKHFDYFAKVYDSIISQVSNKLVIRGRVTVNGEVKGIGKTIYVEGYYHMLEQLYEAITDGKGILDLNVSEETMQFLIDRDYWFIDEIEANLADICRRFEQRNKSALAKELVAAIKKRMEDELWG